jgi:ElaB/YqjD/DUF883 family membrane-anchored ribosome-binding protein
MIDERLIQRCVDNELSAPEREELLRQLEQDSDGWQLLACTYMEEQLFAAAVVASDSHEAQRIAHATQPPTARPRHWFYHPLMSVALSASVAFLLGVLISREVEWNAEQQAALAAVDVSSPAVVADSGTDRSATVAGRAKDQRLPNAAQVSEVAAGSGRTSPGARRSAAMRVRLESDGGVWRELPVVDNETEFANEFLNFVQSEQQNRASEHGGRSQIRYIRIPYRDGRVIVVPVEHIFLSPRFH